MVTIEEVKILIAKYVPLLRLQNWDITPRIVDGEEMNRITMGSDTTLGLIIIKGEEKRAEMYILDVCDENIDNLTLEAIVMHELIHIHLNPLSYGLRLITREMPQEIAYVFNAFHDMEEEEVVHTLTKIILGLIDESYVKPPK